MPASIISLSKSFPSLVLSPTPANTDRPEYAFAILLINSCINTVFPTPAPPNNPIFPPLLYGSIKSITLIPVNKTSADTDKSSNLGASLWIGSLSLVFGSSIPSIASPTTLNSLPFISSPIGIEIACPKSLTGIPLFKPSVPDIDIVLTVSSPRCCWTSKTKVEPSSFSISNAFNIFGRLFSSNDTSTTGPITAVILPEFDMI